MDQEEYVQVYTCNGQLDAEMIKAFLESFQIHAIISGESLGSVYGLTVGPLGEVKILVPPEEADTAVDLLRRMEAGEFEEPGSSSGEED